MAFDQTKSGYLSWGSVSSKRTGEMGKKEKKFPSQQQLMKSPWLQPLFLLLREAVSVRAFC